MYKCAMVCLSAQEREKTTRVEAFLYVWDLLHNSRSDSFGAPGPYFGSIHADRVY